MDIYDHAQEIRLDERRLSEGLGLAAHVEQHDDFSTQETRQCVRRSGIEELDDVQLTASTFVSRRLDPAMTIVGPS